MQALSQAKENLQRARAEAAKILQHIDVPRQEEAAVLAGPKSNPDEFFAAIKRLDTCILFFTTHKCARQRWTFRPSALGVQVMQSRVAEIDVIAAVQQPWQALICMSRFAAGLQHSSCQAALVGADARNAAPQEPGHGGQCANSGRPTAQGWPGAVPC